MNNSKELKWFKDRIGTRIFRLNNKCDCEVCKSVYVNGLIVEDELHAQYLYDCQNEMQLIYEESK